MRHGDGPSVDLTLDWAQRGGDALLDMATTIALIERALTAEAVTGEWSFAVRFVDDDEIARLHEQYMDDPSPTDIMTFPYDEDEPGGDIVISVDSARVHAADAGWPVEQELQFLVLHGVLHVLGWDDATDDDRAAMLERQRAILEASGTG